MGEPLAYLLTWTCYGTWLHGDERGSVDDEHNVPGDAFAPTNAARAGRVAARLHGSPIRLDERARMIVQRTIQDHCRLRGWELLACNVRTNHVHVVVEAAGLSPRIMLSQLKAWTTRRFREARCVAAEQAVWTRRGSSRYLWRSENVRAAVDYVMSYQGDRSD